MREREAIRIIDFSVQRVSQKKIQFIALTSIELVKQTLIT